MGRVKRICVFEHSVMTNFNCAFPVIQRGQESGFLSEGSSWLTACMSERMRRLAWTFAARIGDKYQIRFTRPNGWLCWGLTSQSTIFQSYRDGAIASWVINQYFRGVKCLAQGHNTAAVGLEPRTSRSGVRHSTTEPPRSPTRPNDNDYHFRLK